jgi:hypothetical protein
MCISEPKSDGPVTRRKGHEQPVATSVCGWRYHHIGIPTDVQRPDEIYLERYKMYVSLANCYFGQPQPPFSGFQTNVALFIPAAWVRWPQFHLLQCR